MQYLQYSAGFQNNLFKQNAVWIKASQIACMATTIQPFVTLKPCT